MRQRKICFPLQKANLAWGHCTPKCIKTKIGPAADFMLFLALLMRGLLLAPFAKLFQLNFPLNEFAVFAAPIVYAFALRAGQFYELFLRHSSSKNIL